ncbi:hypothetical protein EGH82_17825 [Vibrio ponticus]|uniref:Uncharacterized protein n=1 Tax=Vibrio ponticus TaxID=265668 RepID=A0A3N3DVM9_9VIBR|nr:hypothetical protein [Vibrio ponticus]ROV58565.1 hypothetical protein EGH82_17825 [Vibrio ponticus]
MEVSIFKATKNRRVFNLEQVRINTLTGVQTTLVLDANILAKFGSVVDQGNTRKAITECGLDPFVELVTAMKGDNFTIVPGFAFAEMPGAYSAKQLSSLNSFLGVHLPHVIDDPDATTEKFDTDYESPSFTSLAKKQQKSLALPYASLLALQIIYRSSNGSPIENFKSYIDLIIGSFDIISLKEATIAMYVFANPSELDKGTVDIRRDLIRNYLKMPGGKKGKVCRDAKSVFSVTLNGAFDIHLINAVNTYEAMHNGVNISQDVWVVTADKKLALMNNIFYAEDGSNRAEIVIPKIAKDNSYFFEARDYLEKLMGRRSKVVRKPINLNRLLKETNKLSMRIRALDLSQDRR